MKNENIYAQFYVRFNHSTQSIKFIIHNCTLESFYKQNKCHAYYIDNEKNTHPRRGLIGYVHLPHFSRETPYWHELVAHETFHALWKWIFSGRYTIKGLRRYEEKIVTMLGDIIGKFWKKYTNI